MNLFFSFHDTYNSLLKKRYEDNPTTHPDLDPDFWLDSRSSSGPNRNWMYIICNATTENL